MGNFSIEKTGIEGLLTIERKIFADSRGFFTEIFNEKSFRDVGLNASFVQDCCSRSTRGTLRGLHYQKTQPQAKLVSVLCGEIFDVAIDLRRSSNTFLRWFGTNLSDSGKMLYVPEGFAHGFCVLSSYADIMYKLTDFYLPGDEGGLRWDDPDISIQWPIDKPDIIISEKDIRNPNIGEAWIFE